MQQKITDDLEALLAVLPPPIEASLRTANKSEDLLEIVLDLGRQPEARFVDHEITLSENEVTREVAHGPRSVIFDEAENRMWAQMAIMKWLLK
jgi:ornithine carbamoyltransferase